MLAAIAVVAVLAACFITGPEEDEVRMLVAADSVDCVGAHGPRRCLSVRELGSNAAYDDWHPLFEGIEGFDHEPLFEYDLIVIRREIENPPADGSSVAYRLRLIIDKTPID